LNLALEYANKTVFTEANGMRKNVKHLLILLADGQQSDIGQLTSNPNGEKIPTLNETAQALKMRGMCIDFLITNVQC